jgi:hypothetical protein
VGDSVAYPVFRTDDAGRAVGVASDLVACSEWWDGSVFVDAELVRVEDVLRAGEVFPGAVYGSGESVFRAGELPDDVEGLARLLPVALKAEVDGGGGVPDRFVSLLNGAVWGELAWMGLAWPAVPEFGLGVEGARTGVQACFRSTATRALAAGHTVYVHVRPGHEKRARYLAEQAGQTILGPPEDGW